MSQSYGRAHQGHCKPRWRVSLHRAETIASTLLRWMPNISERLMDLNQLTTCPWKTRHTCTIYKLSYMRHPETYMKNIYGSYMHHMFHIHELGSYMVLPSQSVSATDFFKSQCHWLFQKSLVSVPLTFKKVSGTENWNKSLPLTFFKSHWSWVSLWMHWFKSQK